MSIAILATGDEIIHGDTLNTNGHALAHDLCSEGFSLGMHLACGDKEEEMLDALAFLNKRHSMILIIGGLGPTSDDRTRFALARFLKVQLIEHSSAVSHIKNYLARSNLSMNAGNRQQALFPAEAILLPNPFGTALGCSVKRGNAQYILLPGPPRECLPMFQAHALALIQQSSPSSKQILKWRLFGVPEGEIAQQLDESLAGIPCETGYRLEMPYLEFKVRCHAEYAVQIQAIIEPLVAPHQIASPEEKASERFCRLLMQLTEPMIIIDEVTGGRLQALVQTPETCRNVYFHERRRCGIHFHLSGFEGYWSQNKRLGNQITIQYDGALGRGRETHDLPFASRIFAIDSAAEWLSFRLAHLLNQLHEGVA